MKISPIIGVAVLAILLMGFVFSQKESEKSVMEMSFVELCRAADGIPLQNHCDGCPWGTPSYRLDGCYFSEGKRTIPWRGRP